MQGNNCGFFNVTLKVIFPIWNHFTIMGKNKSDVDIYFAIGYSKKDNPRALPN